MSRRIRWLAYATAALVLVIASVIGAGVLVLRSDWFYGKVRERLLTEIEKGTGGRAEIGSFRFDWKTMTASVRPFVLHGKEKAGEKTFLKADSIEVGLKVISAFRRKVDVASIVIERPQLNIMVYPDGSTNLPSPAERRPWNNPVEHLIDLAARRFEVRNGEVNFREERAPFDVRGEDLHTVLDFDTAGRLYRGHVASRQLHFNTDRVGPLAMDFQTDIAVLRDRMEFTNTRFAMKDSRVEASGVLRGFNASVGEFRVHATASLAEVGKPLLVPIEHTGTGTFDGTVQFSLGERFTYTVAGEVQGRDLGYRDRHIQIRGASLRSAVRVTRDGLEATDVRVAALGGSFLGSAELPGFHNFRIKGEASDFLLSQLALLDGRTLPWSGSASGLVSLTGVLGNAGPRNVVATVSAKIEPQPGGTPVSGNVDLTYSQASGTIQLTDSQFATDKTRVTASGTLGSKLAVTVHTTDLKELEPVLALAGHADQRIPIALTNGTADASLTITGPLDAPAAAGHVAVTNFEFDKRRFDQAAADIEAASTGVSAHNMSLRQGAARLTGSGTISLADWQPKPDSAVSASLSFTGADVQRLLKEEGGKDEPISGTASGSVDLKGTYGAPVGEARVTVDRPAAYGEQFDATHVTVRFAQSGVEIVTGELRSGQSRAEFTGTYTHTPGDWTSGSIRFTAGSKGIPLKAIEHVRSFREDLNGVLTFQATGTARMTKGEFDLGTLDSQARIDGIAIDDTRLGNVQFTAVTRGQTLDAKLSGNLRESRFQGSGQWQLAGDYPGNGEVRFAPIRIATLKRIATKAAGAPEDLPFEGIVEGTIGVAGPLKHPDSLVFTAELPRVEITPQTDRPIRAGAKPQDLSIRNVAPVLVRGTTKKLVFESARFAAQETNLDVAGTVGFTESPWDVSVRGVINLAILQLFNRDLLARGKAEVNTTIKGALRDPQVNGRLELRDASLYLGDLPVGVDQANGVVLFDRNRATIQKLTAEVGGGTVALGGFLGFGGGQLLYRVQGTADQVRLRYPEGVSTTLNAALNLTGTSQSSLVSGTVTVVRAGFAPRADVGGILAANASNPIEVPETPNEYLRTIQLDVRIETGPSLEFTTALARDIQAEAELRLRGTAARPVLLGTISVNEGEINVFGNKYQINRGEIRFLNPTRIEPSFDVDLQTRARGIEVTISFSGTLNKLNMTYRSDPPLQTNEIIALLAMGRDPTAMAGLASAQVASQSLLQTGSGAVGQAITSPVSNRLQRFFGVSRLKIDPQMTGVENIPQARLTLEQQISRDVTLTYITNLARTNEQIVQIQWDINRRWSAIATRQENGVFGIDFQYRKRFK